MARVLGIELSSSHVRVAIVRTSYRKTTIEALLEAPCRQGAAGEGSGDDPVAVVRELVGQQRVDATAVSLQGDKCFYRRLELPLTAQKELDSVLSFELESSLPFEVESAVYDHRPLRREPDSELFTLFVALARIEDVQTRMDLVKAALGREPDTVEAGALPLVNLAAIVPELRTSPTAAGAARPVAVVDLGPTRSEILILDGGETAFARTLSRGTDGLPGTAGALARELKQSLSAWRAAGGTPPASVYLVGAGAAIQGAETFLARALELPVQKLPIAVGATGAAPAQLECARAEDVERLPQFAKAISIALAGDGKSRSINLRQGPLAAARSFAFLREKMPLLTGLAVVMLVSFAFSVVAEMRALATERAVLDEQLKVTTRDVFGEETTDIAHATELLEKGPGGEDDPFPRVDAFDLMIQLAHAVPKGVTHDVAELDLNRGHAVIQGLLPDGNDAQGTVDKIAAVMKENPCFRDVKVSKITQSGEKQKYILEMDLRCEEKKKKSSGAGAGTAEPKETEK